MVVHTFGNVKTKMNNFWEYDSLNLTIYFLVFPGAALQYMYLNKFSINLMSYSAILYRFDYGPHFCCVENIVIYESQEQVPLCFFTTLLMPRT